MSDPTAGGPATSPDSAATSATPALPDGLVVVVKNDCETCQTVVPVLAQLVSSPGLTVYSQDDPGFPADMTVIDDTSLAVSWHHDIETVPTLLRVEDGAEVERTVGWSRDQWESFTGVEGLGLVVDAVFGAEHKDRRPDSLLPQPGTDLESVCTGQHQVDDEGVVATVAGSPKTLGAVECDLDDKPLAFETSLQGGGDLLVVFDE